MRKAINKLFFLFIGCTCIPLVSLATEDRNTIGYETTAAQAAVDEINYQKSAEKIGKLQQKLSELEDRKNSEMLAGEEVKSLGNGVEEGAEEVSPANMPIDNINIEEEIEEIKKSIEEEQVQNSLDEIRAKSSADQVSKKASEVDFQSYRMNCNIAVKDAYLTYLDSAIAEMEEKQKVEEAKLSKGYTTSIETESISAQLNSLKAQQYTSQRQKEVLLNNLNENGGSYEGFGIAADLPTLDSGYYENFLSVSTKKKEYESQISVYSNYLQTPHEDNDRVTLQMQLVQLQLADYESQLNTYVNEMMMNYETLKNESDAKQGEIDVQIKKVDALQKLFDKGKVTKTEVAEANTYLEKLRYEQIQLAGQANIAKCILDNQIEGQSLQ